MRFEAPVIERLLATAWWDWPADKVTRNLAALTGNDPAALDRLR
jgi:virginiamycin A acetyltransferase